MQLLLLLFTSLAGVVFGFVRHNAGNVATSFVSFLFCFCYILHDLYKCFVSSCMCLRPFDLYFLFSCVLFFILPDMLYLKKLLFCLAKHGKSAAYIHPTAKDILTPSHTVFSAFTCTV